MRSTSATTHGAALDELGGARYVRLTTFRRTGEPVPTPVLCAVEDGCVYVLTREGSGKVKRLRGDDRVSIGASSARGVPAGAAFSGRAALLPRQRGGRIDRCFAAKYGAMWWLTDRLGRGRKADAVFLAIHLDAEV